MSKRQVWSERWGNMSVRMVGRKADPPIETQQQWAPAGSDEERQYIEYATRQRQPDTQPEAAKVEKVHTLIGLVALVCLSFGAWRAWGPGYGLMVPGLLLLAGVVFARTRKSEPEDTP